MRILFYTRFEGNTGGDETFLKTLQFYLFTKLDHHTEVHLCLSYDAASEVRAKRVTAQWMDDLGKKGLDGKVWMFLTTEKSFEKSVIGARFKYIDFNKKQVDGSRELVNLDNNISWYIRSLYTKSHMDGFEHYYLYKNKILQELKRRHSDAAEVLPLGTDVEEEVPLQLMERNCYAALNKSADAQKYPLYVFDDKALLYYKSIDDESPQVLYQNVPDQTYPKKLLAIRRKIKSPIAIKLDLLDIKTITTMTSFLPSELFMSMEEHEALNMRFALDEHMVDGIVNWSKFTDLTSSLDLFVVAGWAHLQTEATARYIKTELKVPVTSKILLCCAPGMSINACNFLTGLKVGQSYSQVHAFQPGVGMGIGFPMLPSLTKEGIGQSTVRDQWVGHIKEHSQIDYSQSLKDGIEKDKLVVIYCSRDEPGGSGNLFLQSINNPEDYHVLLVGAEEGSSAYKNWLLACSLRDFKSCDAIPRTSSSEILMRGLHDAEFCMATGSYSILEARYLDIDQCAYLSPAHMFQLANMLEQAEKIDISQAFKHGQEALEELISFPHPEYSGVRFNPQRAWNQKSEWTPRWEKFLKAVETRIEEDAAQNNTVQRKLV